MMFAQICLHSVLYKALLTKPRGVQQTLYKHVLGLCLETFDQRALFAKLYVSILDGSVSGATFEYGASTKQFCLQGYVHEMFQHFVVTISFQSTIA